MLAHVASPPFENSRAVYYPQPASERLIKYRLLNQLSELDAAAALQRVGQRARMKATAASYSRVVTRPSWLESARSLNAASAGWASNSVSQPSWLRSKLRTAQALSTGSRSNSSLARGLNDAAATPGSAAARSRTASGTMRSVTLDRPRGVPADQPSRSLRMLWASGTSSGGAPGAEPDRWAASCSPPAATSITSIASATLITDRLASVWI